MPVVVTGASTAVGRAFIARLTSAGAEVRAHLSGRTDAESLRALGAKVAVGDLADVGALRTVMADAHTVCHLAGGMRLEDVGADDDSDEQTTGWALEAAREAGVRRFLFLSYPGADPGARNVLLRAKGRAEEAVRASGLQDVILRTTFVYGAGSPWWDEVVSAARRRVAPVVGSGAQRLRPVFVEDVAGALVAADDRASAVSGTFGLEGPDEVTADELIDLVAGRPKRKLHLSPALARRAASVAGRPLSSAALEILASDSLADAPDAAREFGIDRTSLREGLARSSPPESEGRLGDGDAED